MTLFENKQFVAGCLLVLLYSLDAEANSATLAAATNTPVPQVSVPAEVEKAMQMPEGEERTKVLLSAGKVWAEKEPTAALPWALQLLPAPPSGKVSSVVAEICLKTNGKVSADLLLQKAKSPSLHSLLHYWAVVDPSAAAAWCEQTPMPKEVRYLVFYSVGAGLCDKDPSFATAWAMKLASEVDRLAAIHGLALVWGRKDPPGVTTWIKQLKPEDIKIAAQAVAGDWKFNRFKSGGARNEAAVKEWLDQFPLSESDKECVLQSHQINPYSPGAASLPQKR